MLFQGGVDSALIDCSNIVGPAGIYIYSSSYFSVDGVTIRGCGGNPASPAGVVVVGNATTENSNMDSLAIEGNSTNIINSRIYNSTGHGIYISDTVITIFICLYTVYIDIVCIQI